MPQALTKVGRYQITGELGRGSMGVVYQAFDPVIGRTIAIKTMLTEGLSSAEFEEYKARFQREAQAAGVLSHPSIVTVFDFGEDGGVLYLAMECLDGDSLESVVESRTILPIETIIPIYEQVCSALDHAHANKIVHRDTKPANIMILKNGQVKVTDFGIAKMMATGMTQAGQILGTPNYMSPEQVKGRPVDGRSDIFSLGVILYELLTGEKPFGGQNITTVIYKIINENPISPRELDSAIHPGLSYITSKALAKNPDDRYQTCRQLAEDLKNYKNLGVSPGPGATVVLRTPLPSAAPRLEKPAAPQPRPVAPPARAAPAPPVAAVEAREEEGPSPLTWALVALLVVAGLGAGYYFYFARGPAKASMDNTAAETAKASAPAQELAAPKVGGITVTTNVPGAKISLDGQTNPEWLSPYTFPDLAVGPHVLGFAKEGFRDTHQTVMVEEGHIIPVTAELSPVERKGETPQPETTTAPLLATEPRTAPAPRVGQLIVTSNVEGARISIDGRNEPDWLTPHTFPDLPVGNRIVNVSKEGYEGVNRLVTIEGGRTTAINAELTVPRGEINIVTIPPGAEVTIDGRPMGLSPVRAIVSVGPHTYTAVMPGREPEEGAFVMENDRILTKKIIWSDAHDVLFGVVEVRTIPPGATVVAGATAVGEKTPTSFRLSAGRHKLRISLQGYEDAEREVDVPANDASPVKVYVTLSPQ